MGVEAAEESLKLEEGVEGGGWRVQVSGFRVQGTQPGRVQVASVSRKVAGVGVEAADESLKLEEGVEGAEEVEDCGSPWCRSFGFRVWSVAALEATQGQVHGFFS